ncbi:hypothetical protein Stsp02_11600 [Streptomyces sp. NBRC 14336]|uniref:hypothetical protein n=1 Tax=Streptomyces sp. NBRC 14336 TaxID=3030992 RepID=UPI0024A5388C|nr:hypothetical protein [Streptomyces sp. NBRC 14336]GLW45498.1 hypothetical protein Stsp02_11600 [Streptomyces sp. NBRC 14336]
MNFPHKLQQYEIDLEEVPAKAKQIQRDLVSKLAKVRDDEDLTDVAKARISETHREKASQELAALKADAERKHKAIQEWQDEARGARGGSEVTQLMTEQRVDRAWRRAERLLNAGTSPGQIIAAAREAKDWHTLQALVEELPAYVKGTDSPKSAIGHDKHMQDARAALKETRPDGPEKTYAVVSDRVADTWSGVERALSSAAKGFDRLTRNPDTELLKALTLRHIEDNATVKTLSQVREQAQADADGGQDGDDSGSDAA